MFDIEPRNVVDIIVVYIIVVKCCLYAVLVVGILLNKYLGDWFLVILKK